MSAGTTMQALTAKGWDLRPVHDLEACQRSGGWVAVGDDPQFLLTPPEPVPPGWLLVRVVLRAVSGTVRSPVLYVDHGAGFEEQTRVVLADGDVDGQVDALIALARPAAGFRFDPSDGAGEFDLVDLDFRPLSARQAVWHCLREERRQWAWASPVRFAGFLAQARSIVESSGDAALLDWVESIRGDAAHPTRYLRWIGHAERRMADIPRDATGICVALLPHEDIDSARAAYDSVVSQLGPHDELLVSALLAAHLPASLHAGVRIVRDARPEFFGVHESRARFITWIGPGECLHPNALAVACRALGASPGTRIAYTDEDFIDADGERHSPCFKPEWDRELLVAQDYLSRSVVVERELAVEYADRFSGAAWLYAASLEASEALQKHERLHVPAITRHHRHSRGGLHAPLHADAAALEDPMREALRDWAARWHPHAEVAVAVGSGLPRLKWPLPAGLSVDIVIPTRDRVDLLATCVDSILRLTDAMPYTVIVLDNGSTEPATLEYLERISLDVRVRVLRHDVPFNYSAINNHAVAQGTGDIVVLLNNDIEVVDGRWLREISSLAARPGIGAVGAKLLYPDRTIQHAGVLLGVGAVPGGVAAHAYAHLPETTPGYFGRALAVQSMSAVTAACLAVRREVFDEVGGLDPALAVAFNDVDFCLRVREAGYTNLWTPHAVLLHHESASRGYEDTPEKQLRFVGEVRAMHERWHGAFGCDPAYSPNLALVPKEFTIDPLRHARL